MNINLSQQPREVIDTGGRLLEKGIPSWMIDDQPTEPIPARKCAVRFDSIRTKSSLFNTSSKCRHEALS
jgi:hypothetical protein